MPLLTTLDAHIALEVKGASMPLLASVEKRVLRDFCARTRVWVVAATPFNSVISTQTYAVTPPSDSEVVRFERVKFAGVPLGPTTESDLDAESDDWETHTGTPTHYFSRDGIGLSLYPTPNLIGEVTARVSLKPSAATTSYPALLDQFQNEIVAGVKSALMLMPGVTWSNPNIGAAYAALYEAGVDSAALAAFRGLTKAKRRTVPQYI